LVPSEAAPAATAIAVGWPNFLASTISQLARQHLLSALTVHSTHTHTNVTQEKEEPARKIKEKEKRRTT
jgi:hypothetical protein